MNSQKDPPIGSIGLCGLIGSGKSTLANFLRQQGYCVIDADAEVHWLYANDRDLRTRLAWVFGAEMVKPTGINRERMATLVFSNPERLQRLEALVYPPLQRRISEIMQKKMVHDAPNGYKDAIGFCIDAALLPRWPQVMSTLDAVVVVETSAEIRRQRLQKRGMNLSDIEARMQSQVNLATELQNLQHPRIIRLANNSSAETFLQLARNAFRF